jgi:hypothetical protein
MSTNDTNENSYKFTSKPGYVAYHEINLIDNVYFSIYITKNVDETKKFDKVEIVVDKYDKNKNIQVISLKISTLLTKNKRIKDMKCNINYLEKEYMTSGMSFANPYSPIREYDDTREWKSKKNKIKNLITSINNDQDLSVGIINTDCTIQFVFSYKNHTKMFGISYERGCDYDSPVETCTTNIYLGNEINKNNILKQLNKFYEFL